MIKIRTLTLDASFPCLFTFLARSEYDLLISDFILITLVAFIDIHIVLVTYVREKESACLRVRMQKSRAY